MVTSEKANKIIIKSNLLLATGIRSFEIKFSFSVKFSIDHLTSTKVIYNFSFDFIRLVDDLISQIYAFYISTIHYAT